MRRLPRRERPDEIETIILVTVVLAAVITAFSFFI